MSTDLKRRAQRAARRAQRPAAHAAAHATPRPAAESLEGRLLLAQFTFGNPLSANIHEEIFIPPPTPAFRYPLAATAEGVTATITDVRVTLHYFYHDRPEDVDVLLVSPNFNSLILMSDAGSVFPVPGETGADLTFTDAATRDLPENAPIAAGLYRPTNYDFDDYFPDEPPDNAPTHDTLMGLINSGPVNGMWRVYIVDDTFGAEGGVFSGFSITFITGGPGPAAPGTPDLPSQFDRGLSNSDNVTNNNAPFFRGTATEGTHVTIFVDGVPSATGEITNGTYNIQAVVPEGTHTISARALDAAPPNGNESAPSGEITVTIDTELPPIPTVPDLTPASDTGASNTDNITTDATPTFTGTALEAARIVLFAGEALVGTADVVGGAYTITATTPLAPGTYGFSAMSTDLAGNSSGVANPLSVVIQPGDSPITVSQVYVRGTAWSQAFKAEFAEDGLGDAQFGFRVDGKTGSASVIPWINANELVVRYVNPVSGAGVPAPGTITLTGDRAGGNYTVTAVTQIDDRTFAFTLDRPLGNLTTGGENGVKVQMNVAGGGVADAPYTLQLNALQGDVNQTGAVLADDFSDVKKKFFRSTSAEGPAGDTQYTVFHDVNGSGSILADDFSEVKKRFFDNFQGGLPAAAAPFSATRIGEEVLGA